MNITDKYNSYIPLAKTGDIALFSGTGFLSDAIKSFTHTYFSHSAVVIDGSQLIVLQSTINKKANGVETYPMLQEMKGDIDFVILRPFGFTDAEINKALDGLEDKIKEHSKYNKLFYLRYLLWLAFKWDDPHLTQHNAYVCSQAVQLYTNGLPIAEFVKIDMPIPATFYNIKTPLLKIIVDKG